MSLRKIGKSVLLSAALIFIWCAAAKAQKIGPIEADVPEDWRICETETQVIFKAPGNTAAVTVMAEKTEGASLGAIAKRMSRQLAGSTPKTSGDGFKFVFRNLDGIECETFVTGGGNSDLYLVIITAGEHPRIKNLIDSISFIR